jgi:hypothetical protein
MLLGNCILPSGQLETTETITKLIPSQELNSIDLPGCDCKVPDKDQRFRNYSSELGDYPKLILFIISPENISKNILVKQNNHTQYYKNFEIRERKFDRIAEKESRG